jgi:hypothetical protein
MNSQQSSSRERIAAERQKLNQMSIQLYLAAQEKEDEGDLARIISGLEVATTEPRNTGRAVGVRLASLAA